MSFVRKPARRSEAVGHDCGSVRLPPRLQAYNDTLLSTGTLQDCLMTILTTSETGASSNISILRLPITVLSPMSFHLPSERAHRNRDQNQYDKNYNSPDVGSPT